MAINGILTRYGVVNTIQTTPQEVWYKGKSQFDSGAFYCPYIPLTMSGVFPPELTYPDMNWL